MSGSQNLRIGVREREDLQGWLEGEGERSAQLRGRLLSSKTKLGPLRVVRMRCSRSIEVPSQATLNEMTVLLYDEIVPVLLLVEVRRRVGTVERGTAVSGEESYHQRIFRIVPKQLLPYLIKVFQIADGCELLEHQDVEV